MTTRNGVTVALIGAVMLASVYFTFMHAPTEATLGHVQRIMYIHVPMAWLSFFAFFIVFVGSIMYLWKRTAGWDAIAVSAAELGVIFTTLTLITGPIWAKPVWGIWWTWDPRLTSTLALWIIYVGYLLLRAYSPNKRMASTLSAALGIVGFLDVPIVYFAVDWWRTQHQRLVVGGPSVESDLHTDMWLALLVSLAAFTLVFFFMLKERVGLKRLEADVRSLQDDYATGMAANG